MKFEDFVVGKTYTFGVAGKYLCLARSHRDQRPIMESTSGVVENNPPFKMSLHSLDKWEEYKEPVIHKMKLVWLKPIHGGKIWTATHATDKTDKEIKGHYMQNDVIKIEEVTYEEKFDD